MWGIAPVHHDGCMVIHATVLAVQWVGFAIVKVQQRRCRTQLCGMQVDDHTFQCYRAVRRELGSWYLTYTEPMCQAGCSWHGFQRFESSFPDRDEPLHFL